MRTLGRTGLEVTVLGFGAMELRGVGSGRGRPLSDEQAGAVLNGVLDSGINYIDTSIDYGVSEERIGAFISGRRSEYYLASKCGCQVLGPPPPPGERAPHVFTKENIVAGVEQSLRRMQTDYLDVVQFHASPSKEVLENEDSISALVELRDQGKIRFLGSSSTLPNLADHIDMGVFDVFQIPYSALQREHEESISAAAQSGAGTVIRGGVARGEPGEGTGEADTWSQFDAAKLDDLLDGASRSEFHAALHHQPSRALDDDRRHTQPGPPRGERRSGGQGPARSRDLRRGAAPPGRGLTAR